MTVDFTRLDPTKVRVDCSAGCKQAFIVPFTVEEEVACDAGATIPERLDDEQRELLTSGTCGFCWETMIEGEEDDIEELQVQG